MADKIIQLHKADAPSEQWFPNTKLGCVKMNDITPQDGLPEGWKNYSSLKPALKDLVDGKQDTLIGTQTTGQNIKTINGNSILGTGNIVIQGGGGSGTVTTSGTPSTNTLAKFTGSTVIGNSVITETSSKVSIGLPLEENTIYSNESIALTLSTGDNSNINANKVYITSIGNVGIGLPSPNSSSKLHVNGTIYANGGVTCLASSSDKRLKTDIKPFNGLDIINKMDFVQFKWNENALNLNDYYTKDTTNYGVIAQDVEGVIDDFVFDLPDDNGYKGVRYEKLIPIMAQAIKELKLEIDKLKHQ